MKNLKTVFFTLLFLIGSNLAFAQVSPNEEILGTWWFADKKAFIEITKENNIFSGQIVEGRRSEPNDVNNPDPSQRDKPLVGKIIINDMKFADDRNWEGGTIYDPDNGKTFKCIINMKNINSLEVKGYIGIPFFGKTFMWTRVAKDTQ